jgi:hypothetical protein
MRAIQCLGLQCLGLVAIGAGAVATAPQAYAAPGCVQVATPADLDKVRKHLSGDFCLANDIDLSGVENFKPIGEQTAQFQGSFDGKGHVIRNLTIRSAKENIGLFAAIGSNATVKNLTLQNARVMSTVDPNDNSTGFHAGALAGVGNGLVSDVHVSGVVEAPCLFCTGGGLIGEEGVFEGPSIVRSSAAVSVTVGAFGEAGGLVGSHVGGEISQSYATGSVSLTPASDGSTSGIAGGLVGGSVGSITDSFATGSVSAPGEPLHGSNFVGGLVGESSGTAITRSFATGAVSTGAALSEAGGLIGRSSASNLQEVYSVGTVFSTSGGPSGGLVGSDRFNQDTLRAGYWDTQTSGYATSPEGQGATTVKLQSKLPKGFNRKRWAVTPGVSFPYLTAAGLNFAAPLAITVKGNLLYTFLPISQLDLSQYAATVTHADEASLAVAYTIIARAIGETEDVVRLKDVAIDKYFWSDAAETAKWRGPVTQHATRGPLNAVAPAVKLDESNVIGALRARAIVLLRGKYRPETGGQATQWMVATSFTTDSDGNVTAVVADDPWTGLQVRIDPATKQVVAPADFPLAHFTVNAFQTVTLD